MDCTTVRLVDGAYVKIKITPETPVKDILVNVLKKVSPETLQHDHLSLYGLFLCVDKKRTYLCLHRLWSEVVQSLNLDGSLPFSLELNILVFPILYLTFIRENYSSFQYLMKQIRKNYFDRIAEDSEFKEQVLLLGSLELRRYCENRDPMSKATLDAIEKKFGFDKFFPPNVIAQYKPKQLKKAISEHLRKWCSVPSDDADFKFMDVLKEIRSFESTEVRCALGAGFASVDVRLVISPKQAIAFRVENSSELKRVGEFAEVVEIRVDVAAKAVRIMFSGKEEEPLVLTFPSIDEADFVAHLVDAYRLDGVTQTEENTILYTGCAYNDGPDTDSVYGGEDYAAFEYGSLGEHGERPPYRELPRHQIVLERMLGEGQFGDVYRGLMREGAQDTSVAVKTSKDGQDDAATHKFLEEARTMAQFEHPHIIRLVGVIKERPVWIVMELAPLGELRPYLLEKSDSLTSTTLMMFCYQISSALCYLEMKNIIHRDIAARNVLVSTDECVKLADFGMTRWLQENQAYTSSTGKLPIKWMAPESIHYRRFSSASDVWMFAVCMWEILQCGMKPFQGVKNNDAIQMIEKGTRLERPPRCPEAAYRLMQLCWAFEAAKRPTFALLKPRLFDIMNDERRAKPPAAMSRAPSMPGRCGALPLPPPKPPSLNVSVDDLLNQSLPSLHLVDRPPPLPPLPSSPPAARPQSESPVLRRGGGEKRKSMSVENVPAAADAVSNPGYGEPGDGRAAVYAGVVAIVKAVHTLNTRVSVVDANECARLVGDIGHKLKALKVAVEAKGEEEAPRADKLRLALAVVHSDFTNLCDAVKLAVGASHIPRLYRDYCVDLLQKAHALAIDSRHVYEAASG